MTCYREGVPCKIAIVAQAPGKEELVHGRPLVGPSGKLSDECLMSAGILRTEVFITNVFPYRIPNDDTSKYLTLDSPHDRCTWESDEFKVQQSRLRDELLWCNPNVVITYGREACYALTGHVAISNWHGSVLESTLIPSLKVVPTFHPAAALRESYLTRYYITFDIAKAKREAEFPHLHRLERHMILDPTPEQVYQYIDECHHLPMIGSDIENCYREKPQHDAELTHFAIAKSPTDVMCVPLVSGIEDNYGPETEAKIMLAYAGLMADPNVIKVGQYYLHDSGFVLERYNIITRNIRDTYVAQSILMADLDRGLDTLNALYTQEPYYKKEAKEHLGYGKGIPDGKFRAYNALDAATVLEILEAQMELLEKVGLVWFFEHKCNLYEILHCMEWKGLLVDTDRLSKLAEEAQAEIAELQGKINAAFGREINPNSNKQLKDYFYGALGIKPYTRYDKKRRQSVETVDGDAITRLACNQGISEALYVNDYRSASTKYGTFYTADIRPDNRWRCAYNPTGAISRLSSTATPLGHGTNLQNIPPNVNTCFLVDNGYIGGQIDLSQAENRIVAYQWQISKMREAFATGEDVHRLTAGMIFGIPPSEISKEKGSTTIGNGKYSQRDIGKRANHAFNYGLGPDKFAIKNEMSVKDAKIIRAIYYTGYHELNDVHLCKQRELRANNRWASDMFGFRRRFLGPFDNNLYMALYAFEPQSTVGNKTNIHGLQYISQHPDEFTDFIVLRQVHDSIAFEFPLSKGLLAFAQCVTALCKALETPLPCHGEELIIPADTEITLSNFGKASKDNPNGLHEIKAWRWFNGAETLADKIETIFKDQL